MAEYYEDHLMIAENQIRDDDVFGLKSCQLATEVITTKMSEAKLERKSLKEKLQALRAERDELQKMKVCRINVSKLISMITLKYLDDKKLEYVSFDNEDILQYASQLLKVPIPSDDVFIDCNFERPLAPSDLGEDFFAEWVDSQPIDVELRSIKDQFQSQENDDPQKPAIEGDEVVTAPYQDVTLSRDDSKLEKALAKEKEALISMQEAEKQLKAKIRAMEKERKLSDRNKKAAAKKLASQGPSKLKKEHSLQNKRAKKE